MQRLIFLLFFMLFGCAKLHDSKEIFQNTKPTKIPSSLSEKVGYLRCMINDIDMIEQLKCHAKNWSQAHNGQKVPQGKADSRGHYDIPARYQSFFVSSQQQGELAAKEIIRLSGYSCRKIRNIDEYLWTGAFKIACDSEKIFFLLEKDKRWLVKKK